MSQIFGPIEPPKAISNLNDKAGGEPGAGIFALIDNVFKILGVVAGIYFIIQLILAGYGYLSSNGDPKKTEAAWAKITQSLIGLIIVASSFVIASIVGGFLGINILQPTVTPVN